MKRVTKKLIKALIVPRAKNSHKGTFGHALLIAGNIGKMGAAVISSRACLRSGVGLLTVNIPEEERGILQCAIPEAMVVMREHQQKDLNLFSSVGIGPGIGTNSDSKKALIAILNTHIPLVLDADALNIISLHKNLLTTIPKNTIITPHPKEFDRLFGAHQTTEERIQTAIQKAKNHRLIIVLKGHETMITTGDETFINTTGNAGLAKGGSGDALTGMITSFLAQGYKPLTAAVIGVYLHGLAADLTLKKQSKESMLISDVIETIGQAFDSVLK